MIRQLKEIAGVFAIVAEDEDRRLNDLCGEGIFFMPELVFAYACGKSVMEKRNKIFGETSVTWVREQNFGAGGPSDLVFAFPDGKKIVVEFKMRDKLHKYLADIKKLEKLDSASNARIFCVLLDPFTDHHTDNNHDSRIKQIESTAVKSSPLIRLNAPFPYFPTRQHWYNKEISCVVAAWSVGEPPSVNLL
jgi:hypothetical protein